MGNQGGNTGNQGGNGGNMGGNVGNRGVNVGSRIEIEKTMLQWSKPAILFEKTGQFVGIWESGE